MNKLLLKLMMELSFIVSALAAISGCIPQKIKGSNSSPLSDLDVEESPVYPRIVTQDLIESWHQNSEQESEKYLEIHEIIYSQNRNKINSDEGGHLRIAYFADVKQIFYKVDPDSRLNMQEEYFSIFKNEVAMAALTPVPYQSESLSQTSIEYPWKDFHLQSTESIMDPVIQLYRENNFAGYSTAILHIPKSGKYLFLGNHDDGSLATLSKLDRNTKQSSESRILWQAWDRKILSSPKPVFRVFDLDAGQYFFVLHYHNKRQPGFFKFNVDHFCDLSKNWMAYYFVDEGKAEFLSRNYNNLEAKENFRAYECIEAPYSNERIYLSKNWLGNSFAVGQQKDNFTMKVFKNLQFSNKNLNLSLRKDSDAKVRIDLLHKQSESESIYNSNNESNSFWEELTYNITLSNETSEESTLIINYHDVQGKAYLHLNLGPVKAFH